MRTFNVLVHFFTACSWKCMRLWVRRYGGIEKRESDNEPSTHSRQRTSSTNTHASRDRCSSCIIDEGKVKEAERAYSTDSRREKKRHHGERSRKMDKKE